jgi:hypothetical protein
MARPTIADVQTGIGNIYNALAEDKTKPRGRAAVQSLNEVLQALKEVYASDLSVSLTDATDATITAALAATGEIGVAFGGIQSPLKKVFTVDSANDTTDNALQTAKGSAPAANDRFEVTSTSSVTYLGGATDPEMDDEQLNDFAGKAGN